MTAVTTLEQIAAYQLLVWRSSLKLEAEGLHHSGGAIRPRICSRLGLKKSAPREKFIEVIEQKLHDLGHPNF